MQQMERSALLYCVAIVASVAGLCFLSGCDLIFFEEHNKFRNTLKAQFEPKASTVPDIFGLVGLERGLQVDA